MTLITTVIGEDTAGNAVVLPGRRVYGAYSNVAWENVHPSIIALKEMSGIQCPESRHRHPHLIHAFSPAHLR